MVSQKGGLVIASSIRFYSPPMLLLVSPWFPSLGETNKLKERIINWLQWGPLLLNRFKSILLKARHFVSTAMVWCDQGRMIPSLWIRDPILLNYFYTLKVACGARDLSLKPTGSAWQKWMVMQQVMWHVVQKGHIWVLTGLLDGGTMILPHLSELSPERQGFGLIFPESSSCVATDQEILGIMKQESKFSILWTNYARNK